MSETLICLKHHKKSHMAPCYTCELEFRDGIITNLKKSLEAVVRERDEAREQSKALLSDLATSNEEIKSLRAKVRDLRRKIGEWAEMISLGQHWEALREMREEDR